MASRHGKLSDFAGKLAKGPLHLHSKDNVRRRVSEVHLGSIRKLDQTQPQAALVSEGFCQSHCRCLKTGREKYRPEQHPKLWIVGP